MNLNKIVCEYFKGDKPFLIGRNGSTELEVLSYIMKNDDDSQLPEKLMKRLELHSGIFPATQESVFLWVNHYMKALESCDVMAEGWYLPLVKEEKCILDSVIPNRDKITLRNLEPYYATPDLRWTRYLDNKSVAIINSFANTCEEQTYMSKAVWPTHTDTLLPSSTRWYPFRTYFPPNVAGVNIEISWKVKTWHEAVDLVVEEVKSSKSKIDVAIIGCGALGMIIASRLKNLGIQCVLMGGAIQILFGIKGERWIRHPVISKFFNDAWIFPPEYLKPSSANLIENACYW